MGLKNGVLSSRFGLRWTLTLVHDAFFAIAKTLVTLATGKLGDSI